MELVNSFSEKNYSGAAFVTFKKPRDARDISETYRKTFFQSLVQEINFKIFKPSSPLLFGGNILVISPASHPTDIFWDKLGPTF